MAGGQIFRSIWLSIPADAAAVGQLEVRVGGRRPSVHAWVLDVALEVLDREAPVLRRPEDEAPE